MNSMTLARWPLHSFSSLVYRIEPVASAQSDVGSIVGCKVVPEFPHAAQQGSVGTAHSGKYGQRRKDLLAAMRLDTSPRSQIPQCAYHFYIEQVRSDE